MRQWRRCRSSSSRRRQRPPRRRRRRRQRATSSSVTQRRLQCGRPVDCLPVLLPCVLGACLAGGGLSEHEIPPCGTSPSPARPCCEATVNMNGRANDPAPSMQRFCTVRSTSVLRYTEAFCRAGEQRLGCSGATVQPIKVLPGCKERQGNPAAPLSELGSAKGELQSRGFWRTTTLFCGAVRARLAASEVRGLATTDAGYLLFCCCTVRPGAPLSAAAPLHDGPACLFSGATRAPSHDLSARLDRTAGLRTSPADLDCAQGWPLCLPERGRPPRRCMRRGAGLGWHRLGGEALPGPHAAASSVVQA